MLDCTTFAVFFLLTNKRNKQYFSQLLTKTHKFCIITYGKVTKLVDFESVYKEYFSKIYNYMFYKVLNKETAEDLTSEFFIKLLDKLNTFDESKANLNTWLYTIAKNSVTDYFRVHKVNVSVDDEENPIDLPVDYELEKNIIKSEDRKALYEALTTLDDKTRKLLSLKYFFDMSVREIANNTGINESTVSTICLRGIEKLKKQLHI